VKYRNTLEDANAEIRLYKKQLDDGTITYEKFVEVTAEATETQQEFKILVSDVSQSLKTLGQLDFAPSDASVSQLRASLKLLQKDFDNLSASERQGSSGKELLTQIKAISGALNDAEQASGRFGRNVGNYAGSLKPAFDVLTQELSKLKTELSTMDAGAPKFAQTNQQILALEKIIDGLQGGFSSTRAELRAFQEAAVSLGLSFGQTDEQFLEFNAAIGEVKNSINDIKSATAFQAKDNKTFAGLVEAANGLAGAFSAAQGAASLFGDESEQTTKKLVQLQSVTNIIVGLQQVANSLQTESGAVQLALAAKTGLLSAAEKIRTIIIAESVAVIQAEAAANVELAESQTAVTTASAAETVGLEGAAIANVATAETGVAAAAAMEAEAAGAAEAAVATTAFSTALIATGIGAVILAIGAAVVYLVSKIPDWISGTKLSTKQQGELADAIADANRKLIDQGKTIEDLDSVSKRYYQNVLDQSSAAGENDEKRRATRRLLAAEEKTLAQQEIERIGASNKAFSEQAGIVQNLEDKMKEASRIQLELLSIPKQLRTSDQNDQLEAAKNNEELFGKQLAAANVLYDGMKSARTRLFAANKTSNDQEVADDKMTNDEKRKLALATTEAQVDLVKAKNEAILNSDRATQTQQLAAISSNAAAEKRLVEAQRLNTVNDPGSSSNDIVIANQQAAEKLKEIDIQTANDRYKINEDFRLRDLQAEFDANKARLDRQISLNSDLSKNEEGSLQERIAAYTRYIAAEKILAEEEYELKLRNAGFSDAEIAATERGEQVNLDKKKITNAELEALEIQHEQVLIGIAGKGAKDLYDITVSYAKKTQADVDALNKLNNTSNGVANQYAQDLVALDGSLQKKELSLKTYEGRRAALEYNYNINLLTAQIADDVKSEKQQQAHLDELQKQRDDAQKIFSDLDSNPSSSVADVNKAKLDLEALEDAVKVGEAKITELQKDESAKRVAIAEKEAALILDARKKQHQLELDIENQATNLIQTIGDATFEKRINQIQDEIDANDANAASAVAAEQASVDSAADKADKIATINAKAALQDKVLAAEQREQKRKEAEFDKIISIAKILFATEQAVAGYYAAYSSIPGGVAIASALALRQEILGAIEVATVIATPIPKYKYGTTDHPGGVAETGHGKAELVQLPSGEMFVTPPTPTKYDLPKHTVVYPDANVVLDGIIRRGLNVPHVVLQGSDQNFAKHAKNIITAINNKQELQIRPGFNSVMAIHKYGNRYVKWVEQHMQF
jgi:hypothetical protein